MDLNSKTESGNRQWMRPLVGVLLMLLPILFFYLNGVGATILCSKNHCQLDRKSFFGGSHDEFFISEILRIGYNSEGASQIRTGPSSYGDSGSDLEIHLNDGSSLRVFGTPVGYSFGNLEFRSLDSLRTNPIDQEIHLESYSYGGKLLFIGPTMGFIGYILILIGLVRPVTPDIESNRLQKNRIYNLSLFSFTLTIVIFSYYILLNLGKSYLLSHFF